jgi:hypothetical protein
MPAYRNDTERRITHADIAYLCWMPGEAKELPYYVPYEKLGLTKISDIPLTERNAYDWTVELSPYDPAVIDLPYFEAFELSINCVAGNAEMYIGDEDIPVGIGDSEAHFSSYTYARCPRLKFLSPSDALLHVKQEERNVRNTLRRGNA